MTDQQNLDQLSADELRSLARSLAKKDERDRHWSRLAQILGRVDRLNLYVEYGHESLRAWAMNELDIPPGTSVTLLKLFAMMLEHQDVVPFDEWREVGVSKALLLLKVFKAGGDPRRWIDAAKQMTAARLEEAVKEALGQEVWSEFVVSAPKETVDLAESAMLKFLPGVTGEPSPDPKLAQSRDVRHELLERMSVHAIQTYEPGSDE